MHQLIHDLRVQELQESRPLVYQCDVDLQCSQHGGIFDADDARTGLPRVGSPGFGLVVGNLPPNTLVALELGISDELSCAGPLPLDLEPFGMPGCFLYTSADVSLLQGNGTSATATFPQPIPNEAALLGVHVFVEAFVLDARANLAGVCTSPGADLAIGI